jgi:hypothetical protein
MKPKCKLIGKDGNIFNVIGLVKKALIKAGQKDKADEFVKAMFKAGSYGEALNLAGEYVEIH